VPNLQLGCSDIERENFLHGLQALFHQTPTMLDAE
jgi:hypothetical protein